MRTEKKSLRNDFPSVINVSYNEDGNENLALCPSTSEKPPPFQPIRMNKIGKNKVKYEIEKRKVLVMVV